MDITITEVGPTICLNMIVKDEAHIIKNTLTKLCNKIKFSYWVICDTGSSDGTPDIIKEFFSEIKIPGELFNDEWKNFAHNRSLALARAYKKTDFLLVFDADDEIIGNIQIPEQVSFDEYQVQFGSNHGVEYTRVLLINNQKEFEYKSVIHEFISCKEPGSRTTLLAGNYYVVSGRTSNRNKDPEKYLKDAQVLEKAYYDAIKENDQLFHRYAFYCANSYKDFGKPEEAIKWYKVVLSHPNQWPQEKYVACLNLYDSYCKLNQKETGFFYLVQAITYDKERVESLYYLVSHYCGANMFDIAYGYYRHCKSYYEENYLSLSMKTKLFLHNDKYFFYLPYYMILVCDNVKENEPTARKTISKMFEIIFTSKFKEVPDFFISNMLYNLQFFIDDAIQNVTDFVSLFQSYVHVLESSKALNLGKYDFLKKFEKYGIVFEHRKMLEPKFNKEECKNSKKILLYTGFSNVHWNYTYSTQNALGGSETAAYNLAKNIPKHYEVYIGGHVEEEIIDNIHFVNLNTLSTITKEMQFHTLIVSRYTGFYEMFPETSFYQSFIWGHDTILNSYGCDLEVSVLLNKWSSRIDGCICQTEWHRNEFQKHYPQLVNKIFIINNGIQVEKFIYPIEKVQGRFIYSSCTERGLDRLLELWPEIEKNLPNAELCICSYNAFPHNEYEVGLQKLMARHNNIKHFGRLNRDDLYKLMSSAEYWLYPTNWPETSCITAMEMLMSEVICVYYPVAGLINTLGDYGISVSRGDELAVITGLTSERKTEIRARGKEYAKTCSWANRLLEWNRHLGLGLEVKNKKTWVFYYRFFIVEPIIQYISNLNSEEFEVILTSDKNFILESKPDVVTLILNNYMNDSNDCIFDKNIFVELENAEFSFLQLEPLNLPHRLECIKQEFINNPGFNKYIINDYSLSNIRVLNENGISNTKHLPYLLGEEERSFLTNINKETKKIYDFGFINKKNSTPITPPRRNKVLEFLISAGFSVNIVAGFDENRDKELAKCKTILNIHGQINENPNPSAEESSNIFEHIRCDRLLECGFNVLSENSLYLDMGFVENYPNLQIIEYEDFMKMETYEKLGFVPSKKIIDCFTFYNELDLLNYRLNVLDEFVDYFVLVEASQTHSGKSKPLYFEDNKHLFETFGHKIIHVVVDLPLSEEDLLANNGDSWTNERFQRNAISHGLDKIQLNGKDLLIVSDLDEIPDPETLTKIKKMDISVLKLEQDFYYYNLNSKRSEKWYHSKIISYKTYKDLHISCDGVRFIGCDKIENGGWHLSYFGNPNFVKNKLENFAHQEYNSDTYKNLNDIDYKIKNGIDLFNRSGGNEINLIDIKDNAYLPPKYEVHLKAYYKEEPMLIIPKKYCFIHSCNLENIGTGRLDSLINLINTSGLIHVLDKVLINNIGVPIQDNYLQKYGKLSNKYEITNYSETAFLFENPTINKLIEFSKNNQNGYALYLHTKGVTRGDTNQNINDWINMMLYFLVEQHEKCIEFLDNDYDTLGCNYMGGFHDLPYHFSGNFWWVKTNYFKDLNKLDEVNPSRSEPEFILFKNSPKFLELHNSNINHYYCDYPRYNYAKNIADLNTKKIFVRGGQFYGLGNCLFQIAAAIYYCEKHNYTLFIDGTSDSLIGGTANKFNRRQQQQNESYLNTIYKNLNKEYEALNYKEVIHNYYTSNFTENPENNILVDGYCQNTKLFYDVKDKLLDYLYLKDPNKVAYIRTKYQLSNDDVNIMVGLRLDTDGGFKYSNLTIKTYRHMMNKILTEMNEKEGENKRVKFFIVSDIIPQYNLFKNDIFDITYVKEDDIMQMYLGLECSHHILSESTFHYWIGVLAKTPENVYLFNNTDITTRNLQMPEWNIIEQEEDDFIFIKSFDQSGLDFQNATYSMPILKEMALNDPNCVAFNTMGWLKKEVRCLTSCSAFGPNEGVYIKKSYASNIENVIRETGFIAPNISSSEFKCPFSIKYGTKKINIDITEPLLLNHNVCNVITIPKFDWYRPQLFTDPIFGVKKSIFVIDSESNEFEYNDDLLEIVIDLNTNSVYTK